MNFCHRFERCRQMLEQPTTENAVRILVGQWQIISISEPDVDTFPKVVLHQFRRVVNGDDSLRVLLREPAAARADIYDVPAIPKVFLIEQRAEQQFIFTHFGAGSKDVTAVGRVARLADRCTHSD